MGSRRWAMRQVRSHIWITRSAELKRGSRLVLGGVAGVGRVAACGGRRRQWGAGAGGGADVLEVVGVHPDVGHPVGVDVQVGPLSHGDRQRRQRWGGVEGEGERFGDLGRQRALLVDVGAVGGAGIAHQARGARRSHDVAAPVQQAGGRAGLASVQVAAEGDARQPQFAPGELARGQAQGLLEGGGGV